MQIIAISTIYAISPVITSSFPTTLIFFKIERSHIHVLFFFFYLFLTLFFYLRPIIEGLGYLLALATPLLPPCYDSWLSKECSSLNSLLPFSVNAYFCLGLLGLFGIVSSIKPASNNGLSSFWRNLFLFFFSSLLHQIWDGIALLTQSYNDSTYLRK